MNKQVQNISQQIVDWYKKYGRHELPWRRNITPYRIWISEIMLQQTQVKTVIPYFKNFLKKYPTLRKISQASEDEIMAQWSGLGFYRRARNIFLTKEIIKNDFNNIFPKTYNEILSLPGIGKSTAGAIKSLAYLTPKPILDGNVKRVITRLVNKGIKPIKEKEFWQISEKLLHTKDCFSFTQGIMDLGATICTPTNPTCNQCPLKLNCQSAFKVKIKPKNKKRSIKRLIEMNLQLIHTEKSFLLVKNEEDSIWSRLWIPFNRATMDSYLNKLTHYKNEQISHQLTHRVLDLSINIYKSEKEFKIQTNKKYKWIKKDKIKEYGIPKPINKLMNEL